jgi:hypothetical protein
VTKGQKAAAWIAAPVVALGAGAVKYGDDVARNVDDVSRSARPHPYEPKLPTWAVDPLPPPRLPPSSHVEVQTTIDAGAAQIERDSGATSESARQATTSFACGVIETSLENLRLPYPDELADIAVGALADAVIELPPGSAAWYNLETINDSLGDAITNDFTGEVERPDAEDLANDIGCTLVS